MTNDSTTPAPGSGEHDADRRLAVYGSLAPGRPNDHVLAPLTGTWTTGTVRGHLRAEGWGSELGYPGIALHPDGPDVTVEVLASDDLPDWWERLDDFEGPGYRRVVVEVTTDDGLLTASIYELAPPD